MSRPRKQHFIAFGPEVPVVPIKDFSKMGLTGDEWADVWSIIGPSVERNMSGRRAMPLWMVIAAAYLEGLHHGSALTRSNSNGDTNETRS